MGGQELIDNSFTLTGGLVLRGRFVFHLPLLQISETAGSRYRFDGTAKLRPLLLFSSLLPNYPFLLLTQTDANSSAVLIMSYVPRFKKPSMRYINHSMPTSLRSWLLILSFREVRFGFCPFFRPALVFSSFSSDSCRCFLCSNQQTQLI